jgi:hypothetical protein
MEYGLIRREEVRDVKKQYTTPELLVHGSLEDLTQGQILGQKTLEGNDGCGQGEGQGYDGRDRMCS